MDEERLPSVGAALRAWGRAAAAMARAAPGPALLTTALAVAGGFVPAGMALASGRMVDALVRVARSGASGGDLRAAGSWMAAVLLLVAYERQARDLESAVLAGPLAAVAVGLQERLLRALATVPLQSWLQASFERQVGRARQALASAGGLADGVGRTLVRTVQGAVTLAVLVPLLARADPLIPLALVAAQAATAGLGVRANRVAQATWRRTQDADRRAGHQGGLLADAGAGAEVRVFGLAGHLARRHAAETRAVRRTRLRAITVQDRHHAWEGLLDAAAFVLALALVLAVGRGEGLTVGGFWTLVVAVTQCSDALGRLANDLRVAERDGVQVADLHAVLAAGDAAEMAARPAGGPAAAALECRGVAFTYPGGARPVLDGVSLRIAAGETVALVGVNGAGKSTLARLLLGLYPPSAGSVTVAGLEAEQARRRGLCAAVFQDAVHYPVPLGEAVALGGGSGERLDASLRGAGLEALAKSLPLGTQTPLGREFAGGIDLSGGQWQRVALARALYRGAPLVVLDEPAAALDPLAEADLYRRFRELLAGRTAVMITHRLGATRFVDRILVLDGGRIAEQGSHAELVARGGVYAALYEAQAGWYR